MRAGGSQQLGGGAPGMKTGTRCPGGEPCDWHTGLQNGLLVPIVCLDSESCSLEKDFADIFNGKCFATLPSIDCG